MSRRFSFQFPGLIALHTKRCGLLLRELLLKGGLALPAGETRGVVVKGVVPLEQLVVCDWVPAEGAHWWAVIAQ